jgi:TonB family protein
MKMGYVLLLVGALVLGVVQVGAQQVSQSGTPAGDAKETAVGLKVGDPVEVGQPLHGANPSVPKEFRKKNVAAVLHGTLAADGSFTDLVVVSGDPAFTGPAVDAVQHWRYSVSTLDGTPVDLPVYIAFGLNQGKVNRWVEPDLPFPTKPARAEAGIEKVFRVRQNGTTAPKATYAPDPEYSETARVAKYQGTVLLGMVVGSDGNPQDVWVIRKLGLGLDQKAIATVRQWRFTPATKDGEPVAVILNIEVSFHLY